MQQHEIPVIPEDAFSEEGVDRTLIRWTLSLTPRERLMVLQRFVEFVYKVRNAGNSAGLPGNAQNPSEPGC
jgi:hypothetical protein